MAALLYLRLDRGQAAMRYFASLRTTELVLIQLAVPIQEVAPALVQVAGREGAAVLLQFLRRRLDRRALHVHADLAQQPVALQEVARAAGSHDVGPGGAAAARLRHDMVEGELVGREVAAAVLAVETVAQEDVEPREGRPPRRRHVFLERNDAG